MLYDIDGNSPSNVYDVNGNQLSHAYDINGNEVFPVSPSADIVVMSYNIQWFSGINSNKTMQENILATYDADIIGLQEVTKGSSMPTIGTELLADYPYIYLGSQFNKTSIASKYSLSNVSSANYTNQSTETRGYQKAYFTANGKQICWINTHLETSGSVKVAQAQELLQLVQNEPYFIITADLNTVCKSVEHEEYISMIKPFVDAGYNVANCTSDSGFIGTYTSGNTASSTFWPNDNIITSANLEIDNFIVDTSKIDVAEQTSQTIDHLPLIAYLTIN